MAIPRYRPYEGPILLSAGFRPFFLLAALWAALAIPLWLLTFAGENMVWQGSAGYRLARARDGLRLRRRSRCRLSLTAIPNWTGRMPLQGGPLGGDSYCSG